MRSFLLCGCAVIVSAPALAQSVSGGGVTATSPGHRTKGLEEVVVTARRVRENLQHVPVAVTGISSAQLRTRQIESVANLNGTAPNVTIQPQFGDPATPFITIRGFSNGTLNPSVDSPVGIYVDDVYLGRAVGSAFDLADLSSIEVLRGPQGTLFGRNATGGAISLHSAAPTGNLDGHLDTSFGNYGERRVRAVLDLPKFDNVSVRLSVLHESNDGYTKRAGPAETFNLPQPFGSITSAPDYGANDRTSVNLAVRYQPTQDLTFDYRFDYNHQTQTQLAVQGLGFESAESFEKLLAQSQVPGAVPISLKPLGSIPTTFETPGTLDTIGHSLTALYDYTPNLTLKNIFSYRTQRQDTGGNDIDGGNFVGNALTAATIGVPAGQPFDLISGIARRAQHQISDEFQIIGKAEHFEYILGGYYFNEIASQNDAIFSAFFGNGTASTYTANGKVNPAGYILGALDGADNTSEAGYGHATIHLTPQLDLAGGLRYSNDERVYYHNDPGNVYVDRPNFSNIDYDASLSYQFTPNISAYAKIATAYLAGGALGGFTFNPEHNVSYEGGLRTQFLNNRVRLNITGFQQRITGLQVTEFDTEHGTYIVNGGKEHVPGAEMELNVVPIENLRFGLNYGHQATPSNINPVTKLPIPSLYASDTLGISADYDTPPVWRDAFIALHGDANYSSGHPNIATLPTNAADAALFAATSSPAEIQLNLRATLNDIPLGPVKGRLSVWAQNLTNTRGISFARDVFFVVGTFDIPRTYGVDLSVSF